MILKKSFILSLLSSACLLGTVKAQNTPELQSILQKVSPDAIKAHMTFLSDDLLLGRMPGTQGFAIASKYMETQFLALGLKPGLGDSSFIQHVPLQKGWAEGGESSMSIGEKGKEIPLSFGKEFIVQPYFPKPVSEISAPLVFVGFGISAPEFNYDDYKNIDVKGKIVVYLNDAPKSFPSSERAYYTTPDAKNTEALNRGAVGVIRVTLANARVGWAANVAGVRRGIYKWVNQQGMAANSYEGLKAVAVFNNQYLDQLFTKAPITVQQLWAMAAEGKSQSFPLKLNATIKVKTSTKSLPGSNVVAILEGSDPVLKNEYVIYSAHLDHLGVGNAVKGDSIYNGAHDDASGNGILLEIARAYHSLGQRPKRSIIFTSVTGEEMGLLGSDYLANNFPVKGGKIVANLAIDMPFFFHPVLDIVPYGADHSSLGKQTQQAADILKLKISPDPFPEQVVFIRSDHYSFIKKGIPALFIKSGFMTVPSDTVDRAKSDLGWRTTTYHTPQDNMKQAFDFNAATMHVKVNFLIGYFAANEATAPTWNNGDFFGKKFTKKEGQK